MNQPEVIVGGRSPELAGIRRRFGAAVIDFAVHSAVLSLNLWFSNLIPFVWTLSIGLLVAFVGYYPYFWAVSGQTPGKMILGLRVVRSDGSRLRMGHALARVVGYLISSWFLYLGFMWALIDRKRQGWHDKFADTQVIRAKAARKEFIATFLAIAGILIVGSVVVLIGFQNFQVQGSSMQPTLEGGQYVLVNTLVYKVASPKQGDIIVFKFPRNPGRDLAKRIVAVPGDEVAMQNGTVVVNGEALEEPYITAKDSFNMPTIRVGVNQYFVLGDNRRHSNDSRAWGLVPEENIFGKIWSVYWPL